MDPLTSDRRARHFTLGRRLGAGGFGVVYEATDDDGANVAVKILRRDDPLALYRFKREFRSLADLAHPNLVRLYELATDDDSWCVAMERIDGVDFLEYVTEHQTRVDVTASGSGPTPVVDGAVTPTARDGGRLRDALRQLAQGLQALHDARKLHCDIKPSNVLVDGDRVVILDFGLIANLDAPDGTRAGAGTMGYMAPEQVAAGPLTAATDWYAVGCMLHQALKGSLPAPGARCTGVDADLAELAVLCEQLLAVDPAARPSGTEVLRTLGAPASTPSKPPRARVFGRDRELAALGDAWRSSRELGTTVVRVAGPSGIGKSHLVAHFLDGLHRHHTGTLVLRGRCYEQESVPYKAVDAVIDALATRLRAPGAPASWQPAVDGHLLAQLFPVLADRFGGAEPARAAESPALRRRAFHALRDLIGRIAVEVPLVMALDDIQWADVDSARLLAEVLRPPAAPPFLLIMTYRDDGDPSRFLAELDASSGPVRQVRVDLAALDDEATRALVADICRDDPGAVTRIAREAGGSPLLAQQLAVRTAAGDHAPGSRVGLSDLVLASVDALDEPARRLMHAVALAGQPIEELIAVEGAGLTPTEARIATLAVRRTRLVQSRRGERATLLTVVHDRVRETVSDAMSEPASRQTHLRLAEAILAHGANSPEVLVHHFRRGGDDGRARVHALVAAERAERSLAFDQAATHLEFVVATTSAAAEDRLALLERWGEALANAGRSANAADVMVRTAGELAARDPWRAHHLRRRSAELTLRSGRIAEGTSRLERVLAEVGVRRPRSQTWATALGTVRRLALFARGAALRGDGAIDHRTRARLDALWSAATSLSMTHFLEADALALQHLHEALRLGERTHALRGLGLEASFEALVSGRWMRTRETRTLARMDELQRQSQDPYDRAWTMNAHGVTAWYRGDWASAARHCGAAGQIFRAQCRGAWWEAAITDAYRLPSLAYLGTLQPLAAEVNVAHARAREHGDLFVANTMRLGLQSLTHLVADRPLEAIADANEAIAPFPRDTYLGPHFHHLFALVQAELYRGRARAAWTLVTDAWDSLRRARLLSVRCLRAEIRHMRARAALAYAIERRGDPALLAHVVDDVRVLDREDVPHAHAFAALLDGALAQLRREPRLARTAFRRAVAGFDAAGMALYATAARLRLGEVVGGAAGAALCDAAAAWLLERGVLVPRALVAVLAPGAP